jgi:hypothetical protein
MKGECTMERSGRLTPAWGRGREAEAVRLAAMRGREKRDRSASRQTRCIPRYDTTKRRFGSIKLKVSAIAPLYKLTRSSPIARTSRIPDGRLAPVRSEFRVLPARGNQAAGQPNCRTSSKCSNLARRPLTLLMTRSQTLNFWKSVTCRVRFGCGASSQS